MRGKQDQRKSHSEDVEKWKRDCSILARYILNARREIAELQPDDLKSRRMPDAQRQMDAIVKMSEEAADTIMIAAEEIMAADPSDPEAFKATVRDACRRIFEACSFQDIIGQRIAKVMKTLQAIETQLAKLQAAWGVDSKDLPIRCDEGERNVMLNGPSLEGEGLSQQRIDELFSE